MLGEKMKAAILVAQHHPLVIDDVELPQELSLGQVLVRVCYSSICGSQIGEILDVKGKDPYLPHLLTFGASWWECSRQADRRIASFGLSKNGSPLLLDQGLQTSTISY